MSKRSLKVMINSILSATNKIQPGEYMSSAAVAKRANVHKSTIKKHLKLIAAIQNNAPAETWSAAPGLTPEITSTILHSPKISILGSNRGQPGWEAITVFRG